MVMMMMMIICAGMVERRRASSGSTACNWKQISQGGVDVIGQSIDSKLIRAATETSNLVAQSVHHFRKRYKMSTVLPLAMLCPSPSLSMAMALLFACSPSCLCV